MPRGPFDLCRQRALEIVITVAGGADVILLDDADAGKSHAEPARRRLDPAPDRRPARCLSSNTI